MRLLDIIREVYSDFKASKKKDPEQLKLDGWIQIPKNEGKLMTNMLHITDEKGVDGIKNNLNDWQISAFTKGKIGKVGNRVIVFNGIANKVFIGDGGTVVGDDGFRWYHPKNVTATADYNEVVAIPNQIVVVYDITNSDNVIHSNDIYKKIMGK